MTQSGYVLPLTNKFRFVKSMVIRKLGICSRSLRKLRGLITEIGLESSLEVLFCSRYFDKDRSILFHIDDIFEFEIGHNIAQILHNCAHQISNLHIISRKNIAIILMRSKVEGWSFTAIK